MIRSCTARLVRRTLASEEGKLGLLKQSRDLVGVPSSQHSCKGNSNAPDIQAVVPHHTLCPTRFWVLFTRVRRRVVLGNSHWAWVAGIMLG